MPRRSLLSCLPLFPILAVLTTACSDQGDADARQAATGASEGHLHSGVADLTGEPGNELDFTSLEAGRNDPAWKRYAQIDTSGSERGDGSAESLDEISPDRVDASRLSLPVGDGMEGPSVLAVQILLDRSRFSPGVMDGR